MAGNDDSTTVWVRKSTVQRLASVSSDREILPNKRINLLLDVWESTGLDLTMENYAIAMAAVKQAFRQGQHQQRAVEQSGRDGSRMATASS